MPQTLQRYPIKDLTVVGYADVVSPAQLPRIVPPIFRISRKRFIVPPYRLEQSLVTGATPLGRQDIERFAARGEITLWVPRRWFRAKEDHTLWLAPHSNWIDPHSNVRYEPREEALRALDLLYQSYISQAKHHLAMGNYKMADECAALAISANDWQEGPFLLLIEIAEKTGKPATVRLMQILLKQLRSRLSATSNDFLPPTP